MSNYFFKLGENVTVVSIENWMRYSAQKDTERRVMLPMIQRGSVWPPHKVLDLWDTLLRGMPLGAMMAAESNIGSSVMNIADKSTDKAKVGDIDLIDGQQRTLAMLVGWPSGLQNPLRPICIWVDLQDTPQGEYKFRLWATTKSQPFGYARASVGGQRLSKLERGQLRKANKEWSESLKDGGSVEALWKEPKFMPIGAKFAVRLVDLIENRSDLKTYITKRFENGIQDDVIKKLQHSINSIFEYKFPIIQVGRNSFDDKTDAVNNDNQNIDPPLAILFKRVGTGGEKLRDEDYVYSVIKYHAPDVHTTVNELLKNPKIQALYTPTDLVMSAVRLTMLSIKEENGKGVADTAKIDKAQFARLIRNHPEFVEQFHKYIKLGGEFETSLNAILEMIAYDSETFPQGLPKHALQLIKLPLLEVILAWHQSKKPADLGQSRMAIIRFILKGYLCINDYAKASKIAIKALKNSPEFINASNFPESELMKKLIEEKNAIAYALPSPADIISKNLNQSPADSNGIRGRTRFDTKGVPDPVVAIYHKWWGGKNRSHIHPLLLWLQREYISTQFEAQPALAGMEDETPYDFDHILPSKQWYYWTGIKSNDRFIDFRYKDAKGVEDKSADGYIGNGIGNIHVLDSSLNRGLGDASVSKKLAEQNFATNAQINLVAPPDDYWVIASGDENTPTKWDRKRALAFQRAVEQRTFDLYTKFYNDLYPPATHQSSHTDSSVPDSMLQNP